MEYLHILALAWPVEPRRMAERRVHPGAHPSRRRPPLLDPGGEHERLRFRQRAIGIAAPDLARHVVEERTFDVRDQNQKLVIAELRQGPRFRHLRFLSNAASSLARRFSYSFLERPLVPPSGGTPF